jgi:hypothetical protein
MPSAYPLSDRHLLVFVSTECSHHCLNDLSLDARSFMVDSVYFMGLSPSPEAIFEVVLFRVEVCTRMRQT